MGSALSEVTQNTGMLGPLAPNRSYGVTYEGIINWIYSG